MADAGYEPVKTKDDESLELLTADESQRPSIIRRKERTSAKVGAAVTCALITVGFVALAMLVTKHLEGSTVSRSSTRVPVKHEGKYHTPVANAKGGPAFDEAEAFTYLQFARATFCAPDKVETWTCGEICRDAPIEGQPILLKPGHSFEDDAFVAQLDRDERTCIVAFRGSVNIKNWEANLEALLVAWPLEGSELEAPGKLWCPGCHVHDGFAKAYEELRKPLFEAIHSLQCERLAVVGHSLGAATATLAAMEIRTVLKKRVGPVYVFGSPRVGNEAFVKAFVTAAESQDSSPPLWRVNHFRDMVPHLPPIGFDHVPQEVFYTNEQSSEFVVCDPHVGEDDKCADRYSLAGTLLPPSADHVKYMNQTTRLKLLSPECRPKW